MKLAGKIALVTGGGSGIGRAIVDFFNAEGATVGVNDIDAGSAERAVSELAERSRGFTLPADVSNPEEVQRMFREIERRFGRLDVLVNNAGIAETTPDGGKDLVERAMAQMSERMAGAPVKTHLDVLVRMTDDDWSKMLAVHLGGTFYCSRAAVPLMKDGGTIVNMASVAGLMGMPIAPHYGAAKAGIIGFTRSIAQELASRNIRVNAICPGWIETPMTAGLSENPMVAATLLHRTPMHRFGSAREVATVALFLASDDSSYVTGQWVSPNGGFFIG